MTTKLRSTATLRGSISSCASSPATVSGPATLWGSPFRVMVTGVIVPPRWSRLFLPVSQFCHTSLYSTGVTNRNYLRGVQEADANGKVRFTTVYPGCYAGRWPHIHFEVYPTLAAAISVANKSATSQIALPKATNDLVYAVAGYEQSIRNAAQVSLTSDMVFSDGASLELATITGSVAGGLTAALTVAVNA